MQINSPAFCRLNEFLQHQGINILQPPEIHAVGGTDERVVPCSEEVQKAIVSFFVMNGLEQSTEGRVTDTADIHFEFTLPFCSPTAANNAAQCPVRGIQTYWIHVLCLDIDGALGGDNDN